MGALNERCVINLVSIWRYVTTSWVTSVRKDATYLRHFVFTCKFLPLHSLVQRQNESHVISIRLWGRGKGREIWLVLWMEDLTLLVLQCCHNRFHIPFVYSVGKIKTHLLEHDYLGWGMPSTWVVFIRLRNRILLKSFYTGKLNSSSQ